MDTRYLKVQGHENLYRDSSTGAIVNTDKPAPKNFSKQFTNALDDINTLKEELSEIKQLLREIIRNASN
jgi:predicted transcriptional regulator